MRKNFRFSLAVVFLLVLSGCAGSWTKPGATEQDFYKAKMECKEKARKAQKEFVRGGRGTYAPGATAGAAASEYDNTFNTCMRAKGWRKK